MPFQIVLQSKGFITSLKWTSVYHYKRKRVTKASTDLTKTFHTREKGLAQQKQGDNFLGWEHCVLQCCQSVAKCGNILVVCPCMAKQFNLWEEWDWVILVAKHLDALAYMYLAGQVMLMNSVVEIGGKIKPHLPSGDDSYVKPSHSFGTVREVLVTSQSYHVGCSVKHWDLLECLLLVTVSKYVTLEMIRPDERLIAALKPTDIGPLWVKNNIAGIGQALISLTVLQKLGLLSKA